MVGVGGIERAERYPNAAIFNHRWDRPAPFAGDVAEFSGGAKRLFLATADTDIINFTH